MKLFRISLISLLVVCASFFSSCIAEGEHYCPTGAFHLFFQYYENEGEDPVAVFIENVDVVDIFVFNENGELAIPPLRRTMEQLQSTRSFRGTRTTRPGVTITGLEPGQQYRIVAWGNTSPVREPFTTVAGVDNAFYATNPQGGTPLHFGPGSLVDNPTQSFWITSPATMAEEYDVLEFSRAHTTLQVFVVGAPFVPGVEITDVASGIDFDNELLSGRISFHNQATVQTTVILRGEERAARKTSFYTPLFDYDTDKYIVIRNAAGAILDDGEINLSDALDEFGVELNDTNFPQMIVPVIVVVGDEVVIDVVIPGWVIDPVDPGLG